MTKITPEFQAEVDKRAKELRLRIRQQISPRTADAILLKKALQIEDSVSKWLKVREAKENYFQAFRVGFMQTHVFGVVLKEDKGKVAFEGISDVNGRERFVGPSAEHILRQHLMPSSLKTS